LLLLIYKLFIAFTCLHLYIRKRSFIALIPKYILFYLPPGLLDGNRWTYITWIFGRKIINIPHLDFWTEVDDNTQFVPNFTEMLLTWSATVYMKFASVGNSLQRQLFFLIGWNSKFLLRNNIYNGIVTWKECPHLGCPINKINYKEQGINWLVSNANLAVFQLYGGW
jgi:hypothetical protein